MKLTIISSLFFVLRLYRTIDLSDNGFMESEHELSMSVFSQTSFSMSNLMLQDLLSVDRL